jgi:hypothetical protein
MENELAKIEALLTEALKKQPKSFLRSDSIVELATALPKAQRCYKPILKLNDNPYSIIAYASLTSLVGATFEALADNGLSVVQTLIDYPQDKIKLLHTILLHTSGQYIESQVLVEPTTSDPVGMTSYFNWLKRTTYASLVGYPLPQEDDDGSAYQQKDTKVTIIDNYVRIDKRELEELEMELDGFPELAEMLLRDLKITKLSDMPKSKFRSAINNIRKQKLILKGV